MKKISLLVSLLAITSLVHGKNYQCPDLPISVKIGETIKNDWFIWPLKEKINYLSKLYYKVLGTKYIFNYWTAFPSGERTGFGMKPPNYIGCCYLVKKEKKRICAFKNIIENKCSPIFNRTGPINFSCKDNEAS